MVALCVVSVGMVTRAQSNRWHSLRRHPRRVNRRRRIGMRNCSNRPWTCGGGRRTGRDARKANPTIAAKLDELEKQRRQVFVQVKPELEALYAQQDALQEKARGALGKRQGGVGKAGGGVGKAGKADRRAEKKAQKAATQQ